MSNIKYNIERKRIEANIVEIKGITGNTYNVVIGKISKTFKTLEEAREFKMNLKKYTTRPTSDYPLDLIEELGLNNVINYDINYIENHFEENLEYILTTGFNDREIYILKGYYEKGYTLEALSYQLGVTQERIRQILVKSVRRLRYPARLEIFKKGKEIIQLENDIEVIKKELMNKKEFLEKVKQEQDAEYKQILDEITLPIINLNLSVRSFCCLKRAGIQTLEDLLDKTEEDLKKVRNLGNKSRKEIKEKVHSLGYKLKGE